MIVRTHEIPFQIKSMLMEAGCSSAVALHDETRCIDGNAHGISDRLSALLVVPYRTYLTLVYQLTFIFVLTLILFQGAGASPVSGAWMVDRGVDEGMETALRAGDRIGHFGRRKSISGAAMPNERYTTRRRIIIVHVLQYLVHVVRLEIRCFGRLMLYSAG